MTHYRTYLSALALAAGIFVAAGSLPASAAPLNDFDRQAAQDAQRDVQGALKQLSSRHFPSALNGLESAETALLNRESLDLGTSLNADQPLPKTAVMTEIDAARAALAKHDAAAARANATQAAQDIGADIGTV
jgi:hypothetical protein